MTESKTISVSDIPTLSRDYRDRALLPVRSEPSSFSPSAALNAKVSLIRTSITDLAVTSIVNAANTSLLGGGGVDGAIHCAAGPGLLRECETLDGCDTGFAKLTSAYRLPASYVIHAVGPVYRREKSKREGLQAELLASCYTSSLNLAAEKGGSIALSCLSTGIYGYPSDEAAEVACHTVRTFLESEKGPKLERVVFCSFLQKDEREYQRVLPIFFPPTEHELDNTNGSDEGSCEDNARSDANSDRVEEAATTATESGEPVDESWVAVEKPQATVEAKLAPSTAEHEAIDSTHLTSDGDEDLARFQNKCHEKMGQAKVIND
ncbi:MAG: hypothetical protein L6R40_002591 [Gallowayella cf. fulva]|nr:MAG: hypothetical protein L6R40_002591 [Xanthomendoza cf. fulva]